MMRQGGLTEQWRDMARSTESIRQMSHDGALLGSFVGGVQKGKEMLETRKEELDREIKSLLHGLAPRDQIEAAKYLLSSSKEIGDAASGPTNDQKMASLNMDTTTGVEDSPQSALHHMHAIEKHYAKFCEVLLKCVLIPYWEDVRTGPVESEDIEELPIKARSLPGEEEISRSHRALQLHTSSVAEEPDHIRVAEEFLAIRYVSLIRAVLVNMRYLIMLISAIFVLTIVAWNSYPFQPRQWVDEAFTCLLILLGTGIIWVFAQMHRNPTLSRITDTNANELGFDFYLRIATFGAVPVLTWMAYQFPEVGGGLFRLIQPSLEVLK
jgi:hypothetical protein